MGLQSAKREGRPFSIATTAVRTIGVLYRVLDAAIAGTTNTAVARFADAPTVTRRLSSDMDPATSNLLDPIRFASTAALGSSFEISRPGLWQVDFVTALLGAAGAVVLQAGLSVDGIAAELIAATAPVVPDGDRTPSMPPQMALLAGAAQSHPIYASTQIVVREGSLRPIVRGLLTTGVGATPVAGTVSLAGTYISFTWLRDHA
jgi:hypothetical protein